MDAIFAAGQFHAVMGPSGSGKTTLLNLLDGSLLPEQGELTIAQKPISQYSRSELRGSVLARVFQDYRLIPYLSAKDNVALAHQVATKSKGKPDTLPILNLLDRLGIKDLADMSVSQMSGGECQRVALARALINAPKVLLADEPTGALDEESSQSIAQLLQELAHELNTCIVTVTHDPEVAQVADRVLVLKNHLLKVV